jgi:hypothetical protein
VVVSKRVTGERGTYICSEATHSGVTAIAVARGGGGVVWCGGAVGEEAGGGWKLELAQAAVGGFFLCHGVGSVREGDAMSARSAG